MTTSYAYVHCKPDGTPFYVGKGVRRRYKDFKYRNLYYKRVVAKFGAENILVGRLDCSSNKAALDLEIGLIKCLKRMNFNLTNLTEGGEGNVGWKCPESVKSAVAEANKKRVWTDSLRYKVGSAYRGKKRPQHSEKMKLKGLWAGEKNPFFNTGHRQIGTLNHMARPVKGRHETHGVAEWGTLQAAADELGVSIQAVSQAIRKNGKSKGWTLEYKSDH